MDEDRLGADQRRDFQDVARVLQAALAVGLVLAEESDAAVDGVRFEAGVAAGLGQLRHVGVGRGEG